MNNTLNQQLSPWRYLWLFALLGLPALGWYGVLDDFSSRDINNSITNAGLIYGTARGINALVSLLQGTELNLLVMTFSIGEVLDPVNDLIERFSDVVLWALGSLALQKILLALVSQKLFNILLSAVAVCAGVSLVIGNPKLLTPMLRLFIIIAFFRFSLGLVVLANSWVDATFLDEADQQRHIAMEKFQGELRTIDALSKKADEAAAILGNAQSKLDQLQIDKEKLQQSLQTLNTTIQGLEKELKGESEKDGNICALSIHTPFPSPTCSAAVVKKFNLLNKYRSNEKEDLSNLEQLETDIEKQRGEVTCLNKRMRGEKCHFWEVLPNVPNITEIRTQINDIGARVSDFAENTINLLVSLLLKSVAIPLLFFYVLLKIVRVSWAKL